MDSDTAHMLTVSTPAGIEDYIRELAEPAAWPWLQPPPDGPRISAERIEEGRKYIQEYKIRKEQLTDCWVCHR